MICATYLTSAHKILRRTITRSLSSLNVAESHVQWPDFWKEKANQRKTLDEIYKELKYSKWEDWYQVTPKDISRNGGNGVLNYYSRSHINALLNAYPEYEWRLWKFKNVPHNFWKSRSNQRILLDHISLERKFTSWEDWYTIQIEDMKDIGLSFINRYYEASLIKALVSLYPEHEWRPWKFERAPRNFFDDEDNARRTVETLAKDLGIVELDDWQEITFSRLTSLGVLTMVNKHGGLLPLLKKVYPHHDWKKKMNFSGSKSQLQLFRIIKDLLPDAYDVHLNYTSIDLRYAASNKQLQLDVFIPSLSLAIEYQGELHYESDGFHLSATHQEDLKARDLEKITICKSAGITLVQVPYWWDGSKTSLAATIKRTLPDIKMAMDEETLKLAKEIPEKPPKGFRKSRAK